MQTILTWILYGSLLAHLVMIGVGMWRIARGENVIDRLIAVDLTTTLTLAVLVLIALILRQAIYIDVALGLAALGFVGVIAVAKYIADEQVF